VAAFETLLFADESAALETAAGLLADAKQNSAKLHRAVLDLLGRSDDARVAQIVLANYAALEPDARPRAIELLTARPAWSKQLLAAIAEGRIDRHALNVNQVRKLLASNDAELAKAVRETWGTVRTERNPQREQVIAQMRELLAKTPGNAERGWAVYRKVCGQCHKLHGEGQEVGPDLTGNGRSSFDQLLSNVFDLSLVIGAAYQASTVITTDGRVLTGLVVEDGPRRVVLKLQGGKTETIARDRIDAMQRGKLSLMPEGLEQQFTPQELADLFALLTLDRPPSDPQARRIPGSGGLPRE
jgi:putative heme-binding domain-containing protein